MQAYYGFYQPLEQALLDSGVIPDDFDLTPRLKAATLYADLQTLGAASTMLSLCRELPLINASAASLGVLYVLEGATLGGQILRREIAARLNLDADNGAAFLDIYGAATGRRWRDFIEYLGSRPWTPPNARLSSLRHKPHSAVSSAGSKARRYWHDPARPGRF